MKRKNHDMMTIITNLEQYKDALKWQDWYYAYSDDYSAYCKGRDSMNHLVDARKKFDQDCTLWNAEAPAEMRVKVEANQ